MAQTGLLVQVASTDGTHFTNLLAQNASEPEDLDLPEGLAAGRTCRFRIRQIILWATQNLSYEIAFYGRSVVNGLGKSPDPNLDEFLGRYQFSTADGLQDDGAGLFRYVIYSLDLPYEDIDRVGQLHVVLVNRDANPKNTYGAGAHFRIEVWCEPGLGW